MTLILGSPDWPVAMQCGSPGKGLGWPFLLHVWPGSWNYRDFSLIYHGIPMDLPWIYHTLGRLFKYRPGLGRRDRRQWDARKIPGGIPVTSPEKSPEMDTIFAGLRNGHDI